MLGQGLACSRCWRKGCLCAAQSVSGQQGCKQHVFKLAQAQAAAIFEAMHDKDFWKAFIAPQSVLGVPFKEKGRVFVALSAFGKKAASVQAGTAGGSAGGSAGGERHSNQ